MNLNKPLNFCFYIFSGACYYVSNEAVSASEAAVQCSAMQGGRLASVADGNDLANIVSANMGSLFDNWIGAYRQGGKYKK